MPLPKTDAGLRAIGYEFTNGGRCKGCGARISWYKTARGASMPFDVHTYEPHHATCPKADQFRKGKSK